MTPSTTTPAPTPSDKRRFKIMRAGTQNAGKAGKLGQTCYVVAEDGSLRRCEPADGGVQVIQRTRVKKKHRVRLKRQLLEGISSSHSASVAPPTVPTP
jgi:hypothetical protein